ncbi:MAG: GldG family protein [Candidatus Omnitrophica bacterium]|nr:GldG family protein [Candidatus Omnitrophota bacterium]
MIGKVSLKIHATLSIVLAFCAALLLSVIIKQDHIKLDTTKERANSLSEKTQKVVQALKRVPIQITAFFPDDHPHQALFEELLQDYALLSPKLKFRVVDPDRFPALAKQYEIDRYGLVILEAFGKKYKLGTISNTLPSSDSFLFGAEYRKAQEELLTRALSQMESGIQKLICFVSGHDEPSLKETAESGYFLFSDELRARFRELKEINLSHETVPKDASLVILAGPHADLAKDELSRLYDYFKSGGKIILAIDPVLPDEGNQVMSFLLKQGVELGSDVVIDPAGKKAGGDFLISIIARFSNHPAVALAKEPALTPLARSVRQAPNIPKHVRVSELAWTGSQSWAEKNLESLEGGKFTYDEGVDPAGPIPTAALIESLEGTGKMVVLGDSDIFNNEYFGKGGNASFILGLTDWLLGEMPVIQKTSKRMASTLSAQNEAFIFYLCVVFAPTFFISLGMALNFLRRRYE